MESSSIIKYEVDFCLPGANRSKVKASETKNEILSVSSNDLKSNKENDILNYDVKESKTYPRYKFKMENHNHSDIRLEDIPKDILKKYGIIIEDGDSFKETYPENQYNDEEDCEIQDDEDEGKLVIDEQASPVLPVVHYVDVYELNVQSGLKARTYICSYKVCGKEFHSNALKLNHEKMHCPLCFDLFSEGKMLTKHLNKHCDFRGCLDLVEAEEREKHRKTHEHPIKPFQCNYCKKRFHYYRFSKKHRDHCKISRKLYSCKFCKISFSKISQFNKHLAKHAQAINCIDCNKSYVNWNIYNRHLYKYHNKHIIYQCNKCPKQFQSQNNMIQHVKCHNLNIIDCNLSDYIKIEEMIKK